MLKNPSQISKTVIPAGTAAAPAIRVAYSDRGQGDAALNRVLDGIRGLGGRADDGPIASVLLLGRYRHVRPKELPTLRKSHPEISIKFKTVHVSKGREADHVVILGAETGRLGFPSEIVDDPILDLVLPQPEKFHHAEERRVFYVALTRARRTVTILAARDRPSPFVRELVCNAEYGVVELDEPPALAHHRCATCGGRLVPNSSGKSRLRFVCEHRFHCGTSRPACPACGNDLPERSGVEPAGFKCSCGSSFPACPECRDGWLVERKGRYGRFLGCVDYPRCEGRKRASTTQKVNRPLKR